MTVRRILVSAGGLALLFAGITWWALESSGVAVIETRDPGGGVRTTRIWYAESEGSLWLEAGRPENPWFEDIQRDPTLVLRRDGGSARHRAAPLEASEGHLRIRGLMREKYGLRDRWVSLLFDTSRSVAVRLGPEPG